MQPVGCNRFCATCSETIHDLSELTLQEAEALLRRPGKHCVRAQVKPDGALVLRPDHSGRTQRILVAVGASVSVIASACETLPQPASPMGSIVGKTGLSAVNSVKAVADDGRSYRTKVRADGSYRFKRVPYGTYSVQFNTACGEILDGGRLFLKKESIRSRSRRLKRTASSSEWQRLTTVAPKPLGTAPTGSLSAYERNSVLHP